MPKSESLPALSQEELREILACLEAGAFLPEKFRSRLFADPQGPVLLWQGKPQETRKDVHPLLVREIFCQGETPLSPHDARTAAWRNLLIRADNRRLLSSLLHGPLRRFIEDQGGIKLMYIDPPFAVGADFTMPVVAPAHQHDADRLETAETNCGKEAASAGTLARQSVGPLRVLSYRDTWEQGLSSFLRMIHERLLLMRKLLAEDGVVYLHCDWRLAPHLRLVLDEVFGAERFLGDIVWHYTGGGRSDRYFSRKHDRLLHYAASQRWTFNVDEVRVPYKPTSGYARSGITSAAGRRYNPNPLGTPVDDVWDIPMVNPMSGERLDYPTQKPEALLDRIIRASSRPGDLVADFFCGSGTLPAVAERAGRKWLAVDSSSLAVHATRKRLLDCRVASPQAPAIQPFLLAELAPEASETTLRSQHDPEMIRHVAHFSGHSLAYYLGGIRVGHSFADGGSVLELLGFSVSPGEDVLANEALLRARGAKKRKNRTTEERIAFAALLQQDWRAWLEYWSIGLPDSGVPLAAGMASGPLCNTVVWHSARKRKGACPDTRSPLLPLPGAWAGPKESLDLIVTIVDIFANESRVLLRLPPDEFRY